MGLLGLVAGGSPYSCQNATDGNQLILQKREVVDKFYDVSANLAQVFLYNNPQCELGDSPPIGQFATVQYFTCVPGTGGFSFSVTCSLFGVNATFSSCPQAGGFSSCFGAGCENFSFPTNVCTQLPFDFPLPNGIHSNGGWYVSARCPSAGKKKIKKTK
jgi:hypothetical protein